MLHLTVRNFEIEAKQSKLPVVVMFYAVWCGKCAMMKPVAEDIEKEYYGRVKFCEVEIEESPALAAEYNADIVPTFVFFKGTRIAGMMQGIVDQDVFDARMRRILGIKK